MAIEPARGCGYRKVGGLYLCGGGASMHCDRIPFEIVNCPTCGNGLKFSRAWTWLDWLKYAGRHVQVLDVDAGGTIELPVQFRNDLDECRCLPRCPICNPLMNEQPYGLLWIGEKFYSPENFIKEALQMGVSRRIPAIPNKLKLGKTWVIFAHIKGCGESTDPETRLPVNKPGIIYAFRPTSLELLVWESEATPERLKELEKKNITPIIIPDGDVEHDPNTPLGLSKDDKESHESKVFFTDLRGKIRRT